MMSAIAARLRNGRDILELYAMNECLGRDAQRESSAGQASVAGADRLQRKVDQRLIASGSQRRT